jgi:hypothetical protein
LNDARKSVVEENITILWKVFAVDLPKECVVEEVNDRNTIFHMFQLLQWMLFMLTSIPLPVMHMLRNAPHEGSQ